MEMDTRDALEVLKFELEFLEKGGYGRSPRAPWRPRFIFEDSPTCMNYDAPEKHGQCESCVLMQFVPAQKRLEKIPCRHIPLNPMGETLDDLYRYGDQSEVEKAVAGWLRAAITQLEKEREALRRETAKPILPGGEKLRGISLHEALHPKCANPACPMAFHWLAGGKFLRFRSAEASAALTVAATQPLASHYGVKHYWLCERCSHVFTLTYHETHGVILKLLWLELPESARAKELSAA
jgi:hypothetical protein